MSRNYVPNRDEINSKSTNLTLDDVVDFILFWDHFFLEAGKKGNYIWEDPEYGGDNTIKKTPEITCKEYREKK